MTDSQKLDNTISKIAFQSAIVLVLTGVLMLFFPLDAPAAPFADRMLWYSVNVNAYVMGWVLQMIAMLTLSALFAAIAWQTRKSHLLSTFGAGTALLISIMAFIIPKFIAIWSIPQIVVASSTVTPNVAVAEQLFQLLNPSLSFSLFTSFDYLGFWMYGVFGLLLARPLFCLTLSAKIAAVSLGLFGLLYHLLLVGVMFGSIASTNIGLYAESIGILLLIPVLSMAVYFRNQLKEASNA